MVKKLFFFFFIIISFNALAGNKIKYYFNQPVDTTVATAEKAQYLKNCSADTLIAYINRAKYTLDVAVYDFDADTLPIWHDAENVAIAFNNAYSRGVKIRWIYEASCGNTGLALLDTNIPTVGSPQGYPQYNIMHNKFVVIDGKSSNPNDPIVWTGCENWYQQQFNWDFNNIVIIQDSALAYAYLAEFNMMWGDTGMVYNPITSKFGQYKTDLGLHNFTIDGQHIELYFSPSDHTETHIESTILTANTDLYFGMYTFTEVPAANDIMAKRAAGVYVAGIDDSWSNGYTPYTIFNPALGGDFKVYTETDTSLFHNKFVIIDPNDTCSDPMVLTGSHNWTATANSKNDENTLIIHNDTAANLFYQYFKATFNSLGGTLTPVSGCVFPTGIQKAISVANDVILFPNPSSGFINIRYKLNTIQNVSIHIINILGQEVTQLVNNAAQAEGSYVVNTTINAGVYFVQFIIGNETFTKKVVVTER